MAAAMLWAQTAPFGLLLTLCEGGSTTKGSIGYYSFASNSFVLIDSLYGSGFNRPVTFKVRNDTLLVIDGLGHVLLYNWSTAQFLDTLDTALKDARDIALWKNQIIVTTKTKPYVRVYDLTTKQLLYALDTTKARNICEGILVYQNKAYISMNGYGADSTIIILDLIAQDTLKLLKVAQNPDRIVRYKDTIYVQCRRWTTSDGGLIISVIYNNQLLRMDTTYRVSYGGFTIDTLNKRIFFSDNTNFGAEHVRAYNITNQQTDSLFPGNFYAMHYNHETQTLFLSQTDYTTTGSILYWNNNTLSSPISVCISPRTLYFIFYLDAATAPQTATVTIMPNPVMDFLTIQSDEPIQEVRIMNVMGEVLKVEKIATTQNFTLEVSSLSSGIYLLDFLFQNGKHYREKFIKY